MFKTRKFILAVLLLVSLFCFTSCKKSAGAAVPLGEQELPDMIMRNATYVFGEQDRRPLVMHAQTITIFTGSNGRTILDNATFVQNEPGDEIEGSCDSGYINSDNTVAKLSGNVRLYKKADNFLIECDTLEWDDEKQIISTDSRVHVTYENGTELTAIGFSAQLNDNIYEFGQIVEGRISSEK